MTLNSPTREQLTATLCFGAAIVHTFSGKRFEAMARGQKKGSFGQGILRGLAEIELAFVIWSLVLVAALSIMKGPIATFRSLGHLSFREPLFVVVIMIVAASEPILCFSRNLIQFVANLFSRRISSDSAIRYYATALVVGPLLGSLITEPAAMTLTALLLKPMVFDRPASDRLKYATLALLFVNVSIGGTLTDFAAPPVVMVAHKWEWGSFEMFTRFGWKAILAILLSTTLITRIFRSEIRNLHPTSKTALNEKNSAWLIGLHLIFLFAIVATAHHPVQFIGLFTAWLTFFRMTEKEKRPLRIHGAILVGLFLSGLVVLGNAQAWWLNPLLTGMNPTLLFLGTTGLTGITDNAALTYLGSLTSDLSDSAKYALMAGAVTGGGLTVIANAPNPAGYNILNPSFGTKGINALRLFLWALGPTAIAALFFYLY